MEGPTPVSALIHAATMVTAGVYMVARCHVMFNMSPSVLHVVAIIGAATALMAATIGMTQFDIKRVLAYSTVSQLGYMFLACGVMAYSAGIFHLMTHAFFKALLFLAAGSVMHAMSDNTDMRIMGGLKDKLPHTWRTMLIGTIAIAGIPPLAGFWSKDEILAKAYEASPILWIMGAFTALLTAFYMGRLLWKTFYGPSRVPDSIHPHESPRSMTGVLWILAILAIFGGLIGIPHFVSGGAIPNAFESWLAPVFESGGAHVAVAAEGAGHAAGAAVGNVGLEWGLMGISVLVGVLGLFVISRPMYTKEPSGGTKLARAAGPVYQLVYRKYLIDELYYGIFVKGGGKLAEFLWRGIDVIVIDGALVNGVAWIAAGFGDVFRLFQNGRVRSYAAVFLFGVICVIGYVLWMR